MFQCILPTVVYESLYFLIASQMMEIISNIGQFYRLGISFLKISILFKIFGCVGSSLLCAGFLQLRQVGATFHCGARASYCGGFSCYRALGMWAQQLWLAGSRAQDQQLWRTGLVVPRHVGSSWTRDQTHVPCIGRWVLNHCATREFPQISIFF